MASSPGQSPESSIMSLDESSLLHSTIHNTNDATPSNPLSAANPLDVPMDMSMSLDCTMATATPNHGGSNHWNRRFSRKGLSVDTAANDAAKASSLGTPTNHDAMMESSWNVEEARSALRNAATLCSRRGLKLASRWASEQLVGLAPPQINDTAPNNITNHSVTITNESLNDHEIYAHSLFETGEYGRCALSLSQRCTSSGTISEIPPPRNDLSPTGIYLRAYALYLEGERKKEEEVTELRDPLERTCIRNKCLERLEIELEKEYKVGKLDAFGLYVYGVVLKGLGREDGTAKKSAEMQQKKQQQQTKKTAHEILIESILKYPYNWSAWLDLAEICVSDPSIDQHVDKLLLPISNHWMYHFFCVHVFIENKSNENAIAVIDKLVHGQSQEDVDGVDDDVNNDSGFFVQSPYLQTQLAMAYYDVRDYDSAHEHFLALSEREPYRLDHMDAFSNVLYVKDQKVALSHLAHRSMSVDKFRPETCIIVGNYYSSKGRHEKAVQYFQRALKLNRNYLSAWTLLGHEYIEMKNTAAAIEAYRRAVDISDREYRAWYGLGQTYEIMNMLLHALFYFRKAAALHPHDARMWCAIGGCLLGLDRRNDAEKSYERAVAFGDGEGIATRKLAELYKEDGDDEKAAKCYLRHLELRYHTQLPGPYTGASADSSQEALKNVVKNVRVDEPEAEALLYLAYYYRDNLEYEVAIICATRLEDYPGPEKEQGKSLLRDIRSRMDQQAGARRPGYPPRSPTTQSLNANGSMGVDLSMDTTSVANAESSFEFSP